MVFIDTSALFGLLDADDEMHDRAAEIWGRLQNSAEPLVTTNYVVAESFALIQRRLGLSAVRDLHEDLVSTIDIVWVDATTHAAGAHALLVANRRALSLVDSVSFAVMRQRGLRVAFAFDQHFSEQGFEVLSG